MAPQIDFNIGFFLFWIVLVLPALTWASHQQIKSGKPLAPAPKRFITGIAALALTGWIAMQAGKSAEISLSFRYSTFDAAIGGLFLAALAIGVRRGFGKRPAALRRAIRLYGTSTPFDLGLVLLLGISAGVWEEITYRGVLFQLLMGWGVNTVLTIAACVLLFGVVHLAQGWRGMLFASLLGLYFHLIVLMGGSLLFPIVVHAVYDCILFAMLFRRPMPEPEPEQAIAQTA